MMCMTMATLIRVQVMSDLDLEQHGFVKGRSFTSVLDKLEAWTEIIDGGSKDPIHRIIWIKINGSV